MVTGVSGALSKWLLLITWLPGAILGVPAALLNYFRQWLHFRRLANRFPGPPALPLIGNLWDHSFFPSAMDIARYALKEITPKFATGQFWAGPYRLLYLTDPRDIEAFLKHPKNQTKNKIFYKFIQQILGEGLINSNDGRWKSHHKLSLPSFHGNVLHSFMPTFNRQAAVLVELLGEHASGKALNVKPMIDQTTFCIVLETLGVSLDILNECPDFTKFYEMGQDALAHRMSSPWLYVDAIFNNFSSHGKKMARFQEAFSNVANKVIERRTRTLAARGGDDESGCIDGEDSENLPRRGLLDGMLLEKMRGADITNDEIRDEIKTLLIAGHDTTALSLTFILYLLAKEPHVQEKVVQELESIFRTNSFEDITEDMARQMVYLEMVLKEGMRLYPSVWGTGRTAGVDTPLPSGDLVIPAGANVAIYIKALHLDPTIFPDPEVFDPERFSPENCRNRHPLAFMTFSAGSRACIGKKYAMLELKVIVARVLWNYEVLPVASYEPELAWGLTTFPTNGMWLKIKNRSTNL